MYHVIRIRVERLSQLFRGYVSDTHATNCQFSSFTTDANHNKQLRRDKGLPASEYTRPRYVEHSFKLTT